MFPVGLKEQLQRDLQDAMRQQDEPRKTALRMTLTAVRNLEAERGIIPGARSVGGKEIPADKNAKVEKGAALSDADVLAIIGREAKRGRESIAEFEKGDRQDLVAKEKAELRVLQSYLPSQMSRDDITQAAREVISEVGAGGPRDKGKVMPVLIGRLAGRAEGREINEVVTELLASL